MRRKAHNRLWTLILMLVLCGAGTMPAARNSWAGAAPSDTPPPGSPPLPGAGDPDEPAGSGKSLPKPGAMQGGVQVVRSVQSPYSIWMLRIRMVFAFAYRFLFRF